MESPGLCNFADSSAAGYWNFDGAKFAVVGLGYSIGGDGLGSNIGDKQRFTENRPREQDILPCRGCARTAAMDGTRSLRALCSDERGKRNFFPITRSLKSARIVKKGLPDGQRSDAIQG